MGGRVLSRVRGPAYIKTNYKLGSVCGHAQVYFFAFTERALDYLKLILARSYPRARAAHACCLFELFISSEVSKSYRSTHYPATLYDVEQ